jgi:hypothetical protein
MNGGSMGESQGKQKRHDGPGGAQALWWRRQQDLGVEVRGRWVGLEGSGQVDGLEGGRQVNKKKKQRRGRKKKDKHYGNLIIFIYHEKLFYQIFL